MIVLNQPNLAYSLINISEFKANLLELVWNFPFQTHKFHLLEINI
jgi:hypothetical protein